MSCGDDLSNRGTDCLLLTILLLRDLEQSFEQLQGLISHH